MGPGFAYENGAIFYRLNERCSGFFIEKGRKAYHFSYPLKPFAVKSEFEPKDRRNSDHGLTEAS
jgi:hypothetical protein